MDKLKPRRLGPWTVVDHDPIRGHYTLRDTSDDKIYTNIDQEFVFPYQYISEKHLVIDLIYNPKRTKFLMNAEQENAMSLEKIT